MFIILRLVIAVAVNFRLHKLSFWSHVDDSGLNLYRINCVDFPHYLSIFFLPFHFAVDDKRKLLHCNLTIRIFIQSDVNGLWYRIVNMKRLKLSSNLLDWKHPILILIYHVEDLVRSRAFWKISHKFLDVCQIRVRNVCIFSTLLGQYICRFSLVIYFLQLFQLCL